MLTAVMRHLEAKAIDDALELFTVLMSTKLLSTAKRLTNKDRLSTLPQLEKASRITARISKVFMEELEHLEESGRAVDAAAMWKALEEVAPRAQLWSAATTVASLVPEDDDSAEIAIREALANRYNTVRPFLSLLGDTKMLGAAPAGERVLAAVKGLPALSRRQVTKKPLLKRDLTTSVVALLVSEACNIGMTPVVNPGHEALTRSRLVHVDQYFLRSDTIAAANAALSRPSRRCRSSSSGATGCSPPLTPCASSSRSAPSAPRRIRSTSASSAASPG
nr:Tn3 family transposase [Streptantibioticus ferralitis]